MNLISIAEKGYLPDALIRFGIRRLLKTRLKQTEAAQQKEPAGAFAEKCRSGPIAIETDAANSQHYEVPAQFFETVLGPALKYSCCLFENASSTLAESERAMLKLTCERAEIEDGMSVLDLGCGWGALTLWIAENYPKCRVKAVSNSNGQRLFIEQRCRERNLKNVQVQTTNVNDLNFSQEFDRVVSVEMFEHLRNYDLLFERISQWLLPEGKLFVHIFCHRAWSYFFETDGEDDWMAKHFFTGGVMPAFNLFSQFKRNLTLTRDWEVNGKHYEKTCNAWLAQLDSQRGKLLQDFEAIYGVSGAKVALQRWRIFMMSCAELFGYSEGREWFVGHYLFSQNKQVV